eukprot:g79845.t1
MQSLLWLNSKGGKRQNVVILVQGFPDKPFQGGHEIAAQLAKAEQEYSRGFRATIRMEIKQSRKTGTRSRRVVVRDYELHIRIEPHEAAEGSAILESDGQHENISPPHSSSSSASGTTAHSYRAGLLAQARRDAVHAGQRVCCSWALGAARSSLLFVPLLLMRLLLCFHQFVKSLLLDELDKFATGDTMSYLLRVVAQGVAQGLDSNRKTTVEAVETIDCTDMEGLCNESKGVGWRTKSGQNISDQISRSKPGSTIFLSPLSDGSTCLARCKYTEESDPPSKRVVEAAERVKSNLTAKLNMGRSEITMQGKNPHLAQEKSGDRILGFLGALGVSGRTGHLTDPPQNYRCGLRKKMDFSPTLANPLLVTLSQTCIVACFGMKATWLTWFNHKLSHGARYLRSKMEDLLLD